MARTVPVVQATKELKDQSRASRNSDLRETQDKHKKADSARLPVPSLNQSGRVPFQIQLGQVLDPGQHSATLGLV